MRERPRLARVALAQGFYGGGLIAAGPLFALVNVDRLNMSMADVGIIGVLGALATTVSYIAWGVVADRRGPITPMRLGSALGLAGLMAYALAPGVALVWLASVALGVSGSSIEVGIAGVISEETPARGTCQRDEWLERLHGGTRAVRTIPRERPRPGRRSDRHRRVAPVRRRDGRWRVAVLAGGATVAGRGPAAARVGGACLIGRWRTVPRPPTPRCRRS